MTTITPVAPDNGYTNDRMIDSSLSEAKWLFGYVASIGFVVFGLGLTASVLGA